MVRTSSRAQLTRLALGHPLFDIIEEAYRVFSYSKPNRTEVCEDCCMYPKIASNFFRPSIREMPLIYLTDWYHAACEIVGVSKEIWAYLLPRILEVVASGNELNTCGVEVTFERFDTGNPANWSMDEWKVLDDFQRMYLACEIAPGKQRLDDTVCMFRLGGWSLESLFDQILSVSDAQLAARLWHDWCYQRIPGREGISLTAFWKEPDRPHVFNFYSSQELHSRMRALALTEGSGKELTAKASAVANVIESARSRSQ